ncbi:MAG: DNA polymerase IV [Desulfovibrionaceae bacterium]|nr:DNA polymerase IV [Desulfovibrionaceae bacterium]
MPPCIVHIDMDAFYASVEQLDNPSLRGVPVIIGHGARGVVSTCSYEARRFGVHSAMPVAQAHALCPQGVFLAGRRERYVELSAVVMNTLREFSPTVEPASIDEAYLDASGLERLFGPIAAMAQAIKDAVRRNTGGLTCSVGAAPIKFLAKIASDMRKPDGLYIVQPHEVSALLHSLPVGRLPGVGKHMQADLALLRVQCVADVLARPSLFWEQRYGKAGLLLYERAQGIDPRPVLPSVAPKSESAECTFAEDTKDRAVLRHWLYVHAERVGASLRRHGLRGRVITLKIKFDNFQQISRSRTLPQPTAATQSIFDIACALLAELPLERKVRLIGVGLSGFEDRPVQLSLLGCPSPKGLVPPEVEEKRQRLDATLDTLRARFGASAVVRGRLFEKP